MSAVSDVKAPARGLYLRASLILAALTLVGFFIATVNEDISMRIAAATVFPAGVLIFSYPASLISRRMLARSDKLRAAGKVLFFISAICAAAALFLLTALAAYRVYDGLAPTNDMGMALGEALTLLFVLTAAAMLIFLPILQTFVVMILRRVGGEKN